MGFHSSRSSRLAKPLIALVAVGIALILAEGAVRISGRVPDVKPIRLSDDQYVYQRSDNPVLSFELRPNYRNADPDYFQTYERTNAHGQRDLERTLEKPSGLKRILLLGDSVVEGTGLREHETISRQLEDLLGGAAEVLNFGVSGYCTKAAVELLETKGLAFDPDIVVLLFVENDFNNFNAEAFQLATRRARPAWAKQLFLRSKAFRLAALEFDLFQFGAEQDPMRRNLNAVGENNVVEGLARLRALAERDGFQALIAVWPRFENTAVVDLPPMPDDPATLVVERLAESNGLQPVRLSPFFRQEMSAAEPPLNARVSFTIGDRMHPSPRGAQIAAAGLRDLLSRPDAGTLRPVQAAPDAVAAAAARALGRAAPNYARALTSQGNAEQLAGRVEASLPLYREALEEDPASANAHLNLAHALRKLGRLEEALEHYRAALDSEPDLRDVRVELGLVLEQQGRPELAQAAYEEELERNPGDALAHLRLGNRWMKQGQPSRAVEHYREALANGQGSAEVHNNLGLAYENLGDLSRASEQYQHALALDSSLVDTHHNLAIVLARQGDRQAAYLSFGKAIRLDQRRADVRANLAALLLQMGRRREARQHYEEGLRHARAWGDVAAERRFQTLLERLGATPQP